jgi:predicted MFS family arabinose efflux permease
MGIYNSCIYLGMMTGSALFGMALKKIGYPLGFAVAGTAVLGTLLLFIVLIGEKESIPSQ